VICPSVSVYQEKRRPGQGHSSQCGFRQGKTDNSKSWCDPTMEICDDRNMRKTYMQ
jgi:hypothetical protein